MANILLFVSLRPLWISSCASTALLPTGSPFGVLRPALEEILRAGRKCVKVLTSKGMARVPFGERDAGVGFHPVPKSIGLTKKSSAGARKARQFPAIPSAGVCRRTSRSSGSPAPHSTTIWPPAATMSMTGSFGAPAPSRWFASFWSAER